MSGGSAISLASPLPARDLQGAAASPETPDGALAALSAIACVIYRWDIVSDALAWSGNADAVLGAGTAERLATGRAFLEACGTSPGTPSRLHRIMETTDADTGTGVPYEIFCRLQPDDLAPPMWVVDNGRWFAGADGRAATAIGTLHVIGAGSISIAGRSIDALTSQPTRGRLLEALDAILKAAPSGAGGQWALLLVGLDDLGRINERFGFEAADELIVAVARRLRAHLNPEDLLVRFSGNKFALLISRLPRNDLTSFGEAIIADMRKSPVSTSAGHVPVTVTIGAIAPPQPATDPSQIVSRLQEAHERAKRRGRGRFFLDERTGGDEGRRRVNLKMADEIVQAIDQGRVTLALQPIVHATSRKPAFYEALARITPEPGENPRDAHRLVAAAEKLGLMGSVDRRVLQLVVDTMRRNPGLNLSVNVSASSIADEEWLRLFAQEVDADIGARLILELTESVAVDHLAAARVFISTVRKAGARIAIDDFGAGATSFRNLRRLDVDLVKIDGSFVLHMMQSPDDRAFVQTLMTLAHQLDIQTVAEWVQNETAAQMLLEWGCDYFQGALCGLAQPIVLQPGIVHPAMGG